MSNYILALDQGTSSSKAIIIDHDSRIVAASEKSPITPRYLKTGWVEYQPEEILNSVVQAIRSVIKAAKLTLTEIACMGLANQGETVIAFNRENGEPLYPAISWQDKRGLKIIEQWKANGNGERIRNVTGLIPDPYFSASKMRWILENIPEARKLLKSGRLCLATSDTWLLYHLLSGKMCLTDVATASRTMLFNLKTLQWDDDLLGAFSIPRSVLPEVVTNDARIGVLDAQICGAEISLGGLCVDQQAALIGQRCFEEGGLKITYGTGCFMLANIGQNVELCTEGLLTSVGWQAEDTTTYVFDGGIYHAGALGQWLTQQLKLAPTIHDIEQRIKWKNDSNGVYFIPALSGLAAPYWKPEITGSWHGLTIATDNADLLRSAMESIVFRVKDVFDTMQNAGVRINCVRTDGGLSRSRFLMQFQADVLNVPVEVFEHHEATALGVGLLAGISTFGWSLTKNGLPASGIKYHRFEPDAENHQQACQRYTEWKRLVLRAIGDDV